jgi:hypothetical protein
VVESVVVYTSSGKKKPAASPCGVRPVVSMVS